MKKILLVCIILMLFTGQVWAATFYISESGVGAQDGTTYATRWAKAAFNVASNWAATPTAGKISPGDTLYMCGTINGLRLSIQQSGEGVNGPIVLDGACPADPGTIEFITAITGWTDAGGGLYTKVVAISSSWLIEDNVMLTLATSAALTNGNWYFDGTTVTYKPTSGTPTDHTVGYTTDIGLYGAARSYITIQNLAFRFINQAIYFNGSAANVSNILVSNNTFTNIKTPVYFRTATGFNFSDSSVIKNTFNYCGQGTLNTSHSGTGTLTNITIGGSLVNRNIFTNTGQATATNLWSAAYGASTFEIDAISFQNANNCNITDNLISGRPLDGIINWINATGTSKGNNVLRNSITGGTGTIYGINWSVASNTDYSQNNTIAYNVVGDVVNGGGAFDYVGIKVGAKDTTNSNGVYNNTVYNCYRNYATHNFSSGWNFKNNISLNPIQYHFLQQNNPISITSNYNLYYPDTGTKFYTPTTAYSLSGWKTATSQDAQSISSDPLFISSSDFRLQSASPAINAGVAIAGLTTDFLGYPIVGLPDIGAYEYHPTTASGVTIPGGVIIR